MILSRAVFFDEHDPDVFVIYCGRATRKILAEKAEYHCKRKAGIFSGSFLVFEEPP